MIKNSPFQNHQQQQQQQQLPVSKAGCPDYNTGVPFKATITTTKATSKTQQQQQQQQQQHSLPVCKVGCPDYDADIPLPTIVVTLTLLHH